MRDAQSRAPGGRTSRLAVAGALLAGSALLTTAWPTRPASSVYSSNTETSYTAAVPEAYELSGLVASPTHPDWYWAHSDAWEPSDRYAACASLSAAELSACQQVERARLWALRIDPATHEVREARPFHVSNPDWARDPYIAENNDWEDISLGPLRDDGAGDPAVTLVLGAIGSASDNRVQDANGRDITCDTRRLIELAEPDLSDPGATTWTPRRIYDLPDIRGLGGLRICDAESLVVAQGPAGEPTAFIVSRMHRKLFARSLDEATGREPDTPPASADSEVAYRPAVSFLGDVKDALGLKITAADLNGSHVAMLAAHTDKHPCMVLTWPIGEGDLGATLTQESPTKHVVTCTAHAEGLAYTRTATDPSASTKDLTAVADGGDSARAGFLHWNLPHR